MCDMWSVGIMAHNLLTGQLPFDGCDEKEVEMSIVRGKLAMESSVWDGVGEAARSFVKELLSTNPAERPTAESALTHPWIQSMVWSNDTCGPLSIDVLTSIEKFANANSIRRAAANLAVLGQIDLKGEDVKLAERQFNSLDIDGNGTISQKELTDVLQQELGISPERSAWVFEQLDLDGDSEIQRSEFLAAVVGARFLQSRSDVEKAFQCFNLTKRGKICQKDLTNVLGKTFCGKPTKQIFTELDVNSDRVIDFVEFSAHVDTSEETDAILIYV
jgi:calcium-dependent protein kinase